MTDNLEELERLLDRTGKCLDHPKLQVSDRDARALRDRLIAKAREADELRAEVASAAKAERQKIIDDLCATYQNRVLARKGKRPNQTDDSLFAIIQRIAGINPARAALEGKGG